MRQLVRTDVALAGTSRAYAHSPRVMRVCMLLVCECAARQGLNAGELALLSPDIEADALRALSRLTRYSAIPALSPNID